MIRASLFAAFCRFADASTTRVATSRTADGASSAACAPSLVIPANAGIQSAATMTSSTSLDSRVRGNDGDGARTVLAPFANRSGNIGSLTARIACASRPRFGASAGDEAARLIRKAPSKDHLHAQRKESTLARMRLEASSPELRREGLQPHPNQPQRRRRFADASTTRVATSRTADGASSAGMCPQSRHSRERGNPERCNSDFSHIPGFPRSRE